MTSRRRFLRGVAAGGAVTAALPLLDIFLDANGTALAQTGAPLPVRFGTWFWGCGVHPDRWVPKDEGPGFTVSTELAPLADLRDRINVLSGFDAKLDGVPNIPHHTGVVATLTGVSSGVDHEYPAPTLDTVISEKLGATTRFRSLEVSADGVRAHSLSRFGTSVVNQAEVSPLALYQRLFGPDFVDPARADKTPDPRLLLRKSVLSAVREDARRLEATLGSHDRRRLDQYQTSVRELEKRIDLTLDAPAAPAGCQKPKSPPKDDVGSALQQARANHDLLADLLVMALACDQTRVVNVLFSWGLSGLRLEGGNSTHHDLTHNDVFDPELGYQPEVLPFVEASMQAWADFVAKLAAVDEGASSLLDNCLILAHSETSFAQTHDVRNLPIMLAGSGGGAVRTGVHLRGNGDPVTRVGLTLQHALGLPVPSFGTKAMRATTPLTDLLT